MYINQNIVALNTLNQFNKTASSQKKSMEKLSSGLRINRASDDAAGLAISEKMRAQIRGLDQAQRNIQDANSLIQTAEGGLSSILDPPLEPMRELVLQAANDTLTTEDRTNIQQEINHIVRGVDDIANNTEFNGIKLLNTEKTITNTTISTSPSLIWTEIPTGSTTNFYSLAWNGNRYLAVGFQGNTLTSQDSVSWSVPSPPVTDVNLNSVKWNGKEFIVAEGSSLYTTTDGVNRMGYSSVTGMNGQYFDADYVGGKYIAVGDNGQIAETTNPTSNSSWVGISSGTTEQLLGVASSGNEFVVVGKNGTILRSTDATNWTSENSGTTATLSKVIWANGKYIGVGGSGTILTSSDGISWTKQNTPNGLNVICDIAYNGQDYAAISNDGSVLTSKDAVSWQSEKLPGNPYLQGVVWDGNSFVTIGWEGKVFKGSKESTVSVETTEVSSKLSVQTGANTKDSLSIELSDVRSDKLGINSIQVLSPENCKNAIATIDNAINKVNSEMTKFGAYQNRLEHILNNVGNYEENLSNAESRIRDVDMSKEVMNQSKSSILSHAAQAILAQATQQPQQVLQLLR